MTWTLRCLWLALATMTPACATGSQAPVRADAPLIEQTDRPEGAPSQAAAPPPSAVCVDLIRPGVVRRSAIKRVVDAGLGQWLSHVDVERQLDRGRFRGWRVVRLYPGDPCYTQIDVRPGDVVTSVNGRSIERPDAAHAVFTGLADAPALIVKLLRGGQERTLTFEIAAE